MSLKQILELATKLKTLVVQSTIATENLKKKNHYFDDGSGLKNEKKSDLDSVISNLQQLSFDLENKDKEFLEKDDVEIIIKSYNAIIINLKEWKRIKWSSELTDVQKIDLEISEKVLLKVIKVLRDKIEKTETKTRNIRLQLAIKKLINYIDEESKILKV